MVFYNFKARDFDKAFKFAVSYYLDPAKSPSGRTSGEPRGLGAVLDAFTRGKLVEIGVQKMLEQANNRKEYELNFEIMSVNKVKDEPDITAVVENGERRPPNLFVEIKSTSPSDRWLGLTEEQMATIEENSFNRGIFIVYISLNVDEKSGTNPKCRDFVGMYLKRISQLPVFDNFADLHASANLEFIITLQELRKYGQKFSRGDFLYETDLFCELPSSSIWNTSGGLRSGLAHVKNYSSYKGKIAVPRWSGQEDKKFGQFDICGSFDIYSKQNPKSKPTYIYCLADTVVSNEVFGNFKLKKGKPYEFTLWTLGWDPVLKRDNLWISKKRIQELLSEGSISSPDQVLRDVADRI